VSPVALRWAAINLAQHAIPSFRIPHSAFRNPMIPQETIERVAAANDIVDVIGAHVALKKMGTRFRALCPFHREKTPSFYVDPQRQTYKCFGCGVGGTIFKFVMAYESLDFPSAVRRLAERANMPLAE